ncbi:MAG: hypothetical protein JRM77_09815 [Nitrososphaerota archaeon]|jgi:hypothetical protein|nr:hypothetical protein [Nitrososphaerota archaeon]
MSLNKRVEYLLAMSFPRDNIEKSIHELPKTVGRALESYTTGFASLLSFSLPTEEQLEGRVPAEQLLGKHIGLAFFQIEAYVLCGRSLSLALCGAYNAAHSLLRGVVDLSTQGTVLDYLSSHARTERATHHQWAKEFQDWANDNRLLTRLDSYISKPIGDKPDPIEVFELLGDGFFRLGLAQASNQLVKWSLASPIANPYKYVRYSNLNENVHVNLKNLDWFRFMSRSFWKTERQGVPIENSPIDLLQKDMVGSLGMFRFPVVTEEFEEYANQLQRVADLHGVLTLNSIREEIVPHRELKPATEFLLRQILVHAKSSNLSYLGKVVDSLLGSRA